MDTLKPVTGKIVTVSEPNLTTQIQEAQDDPLVDHVKIEGGGSITKQITLRKHTIFDSSTYSCEAEQVYAGQFLIADNVLVEGTYRIPQALTDYFKHGDGRNPNDPYLKAVQALTPAELAGTGTTILEPEINLPGIPCITVFQALGDSVASHTGKAENIAVVGFHVKGRQKVYDGGVRSTILFGNCHRGLAMHNYLEDTASIGITFGGSALEEAGNKNNYANDVVACWNITTGLAAANVVAINVENGYFFENYGMRTGHNEPRFGGGACLFDLETNNEVDHCKNIYLYNNLYDVEGSYIPGNAICLQAPFVTPNIGKIVAANNVIIGGREDVFWRYLINGIFLNGLTGAEIINNYVFRTGQNALQAYAIKNCLIQDNDFEATGGGGSYTMKLQDCRDNTIRRNHFHDRAGLGINTQSGFEEICGVNNVYEQNFTNGEDIPNVAKHCP